MKRVLIQLFIVAIIFSNQSFARNTFGEELQLAERKMDINLDEAEEHISKAIDLDANQADAYFLCGRIMGRQAENAFFSALSYAKKSLKCLKRAIELKPSHIPYRMGLIGFYLGAPSIAGGDEKLARQQVLEIKSISAVEGAKAEIFYLQKTDQEKALQLRLQEFINNFPDETEFKYRYGLLMQNQRNYAKAFDAFQKATEFNDQSTYYYNSLYQLGRNAVSSHTGIQEGIDALHNLLRFDNFNDQVPPIEWAFLRLAQLYYLAGNQDEAKHFASMAMQSTDKDLKDALSAMNVDNKP